MKKKKVTKRYSWGEIKKALKEIQTSAKDGSVLHSLIGEIGKELRSELLAPRKK